MVWAYAFNHEEAIRCFERALELDPDLAIARWGVAYAIGPNYNKAWEAFDPVDLAASLARARVELGLAATGRASVCERGLIEALQTRFATDDAGDAQALQAGHTAYADAMAALAQTFPNDIDVQALAADALVNVTAWALWDTRTGEPAPGSRVVEARRILDDALTTPGGREHPGVLHLYLHTLEMSAPLRRRCPSPICFAGLYPMPAIWNTCPAISTCSVAIIAILWCRICLPCRRIGDSWSVKVRSTSTRCTGRTTCTSSSIPPCSKAIRVPPSMPPMS